MDITNDFSEEIKFIFNEEEVLKKKSELVSVVGTEQKVNFVLNIVENQLNKNMDKYIMNLMVVYSKMNPPLLQKGLTIIKNIKD